MNRRTLLKVKIIANIRSIIFDITAGVRYQVYHHGGRPGQEVFSEEHCPQCGQRSRPARYHHGPLRVGADVFHQGVQHQSVLSPTKHYKPEE